MFYMDGKIGTQEIVIEAKCISICLNGSRKLKKRKDWNGLKRKTCGLRLQDMKSKWIRERRSVDTWRAAGKRQKEGEKC